MRDLILTLIVLGLLPACWNRPFVGMLLFSWLAYMRPQDLTWGFARSLRFSFLVAFVTFAGFFLKERKPFMVRDFRCAIMIVLAILAGVSIPFGSIGFSSTVVTYYTEFVKIIAIALFTTTLLDSKHRLRIFSLVIALSLGFYGFKTGVFGILTGGGTKVLRGPGGMLKDNNDFALAMAMNIPFVFYLGLAETDKRFRRFLLVLVPLTMITIVLTHSRGGFLSMAGALALITWRTRRRWLGFSMGAVVAVLFLLLMPDSYRERLSTIREYEQESSAQARLESWGVALRMIAESPVIGVGFRQFQVAYFDHLPPEKRVTGTTYVAHNSYLQIWAETGSISFFLYLIMIGSTFVTLSRVRRRATRRYVSSWIIDYARMYEASLLAFVIGSTFLNRGHFDLVYHLVAAVIAFALLANAEMDGRLRSAEQRELALAVPAGKGFAPRGRLGLARISTAARGGSTAVAALAPKRARRSVSPGFEKPRPSREEGFERTRRANPWKGRVERPRRGGF